jgi:uncharacterized membrane protein YbhN (UPF0104 family)
VAPRSPSPRSWPAGSAAALVALFPAALTSRARTAAASHGGSGRIAGRVADVLPHVRAGSLRALGAFRRPRLALLGAISWWGFDVGVLGSMLHAFGVQPSIWVLALAYFAGTLFNLIPLPGSLSGGLAGALIALGAAPLAAIPAVLAYRAVAIWLPAGAGLPSLLALRESVTRRQADSLARTVDRREDLRHTELTGNSGLVPTMPLWDVRPEFGEID